MKISPAFYEIQDLPKPSGKASHLKPVPSLFEPPATLRSLQTSFLSPSERKLLDKEEFLVFFFFFSGGWEEYVASVPFRELNRELISLSVGPP